MSNFKCPKCGEELEYFDTMHTEPADENGGEMTEIHLMYCDSCDAEFKVEASYFVKLTSIDAIIELED